MLENLLQIIICIVSISLLGYKLLSNINKGEYVSCCNLFALFCILDVYIPSVIGAISGRYLEYPFFDIQNRSSFFYATLICTISLGLFWIGSKAKGYYIPVKKQVIEYTISERWMRVFFWLSILIYCLKLYLEYLACDSMELFYQYKITRAYLVTVDLNSIFGKAVSVISEFSTTIMFIVISIGIVDNDKLHNHVFWKWGAPAIGLFVVSLTLYRGTILNFVCMLLVSMQLKNGLKLNMQTKKKIWGIILFAGVFIIAYGGYRTKMTNLRYGIHTGFGESILQMVSDTLGNTLVACARCIDYYSREHEISWGKSIFEMFYSFVPRSIWKSKPVQYGIINLTVKMGSPISTMDAVSIPGELILNFGYIGLLIVPIIGKLFSCFEDLKRNYRYKYIYAAMVSALVTTSMWMSFTGFFAQIKYIIVYVLVCRFIVKQRPKYGEL